MTNLASARRRKLSVLSVLAHSGSDHNYLTQVLDVKFINQSQFCHAFDHVSRSGFRHSATQNLTSSSIHSLQHGKLTIRSVQTKRYFVGIGWQSAAGQGRASIWQALSHRPLLDRRFQKKSPNSDLKIPGRGLIHVGCRTGTGRQCS